MSIRFIAITMIFLMLLSETGCVRRRLDLRSNPPGAMAYVNNKPVGRTPIATSFVHYGTMDFRLVKDGYETVSEKRKIRAPWYQWPGIDFFSEVVWPQEITDERMVTFEMRPERIVPQDELLARAETVRNQAQAQGTFRVNNGIGSGVTQLPDPLAPAPVLPAPGTPLYDVGSGLGSIGAPSSYFNNPYPTAPTTVNPIVPAAPSPPPSASEGRIPYIPPY